MIKAILFDKDGTLLEFSDIWTKGFKKLIYKLGLDDGNHDNLKYEIGIANDGEVLENSVLSSGTIKDLADVIIKYKKITNLEKYIEDIFIETIEENSTEIRPTCDLDELFRFLKEQDIKIIVSTSDNLKVAEKMFEILELRDQLDFIIAADQFPPKPDPTSIEFIKEKFKILSDEILMVGDSKVDMEYGKNVRSSVGVLCGTGSEPMLREFGDFVIDNPLELIDLIYKFE